MVKKKSFSIGASLSRALTDTTDAARDYRGELHIEIIPIRKIEADPENPRELSLSFVDLTDGISSSDTQFSRKEIEKNALSSLSNSILEQGVINPILVYKHGDFYRLIAGERRTLASVLAGKTDIPARILNQKPSLLKTSLLQWVENIEREDLSLWERIRNIGQIISAYREENNKNSSDIKYSDFMNLLSCSRPHALNYMSILSASEILLSSIQKNEIKNIEKAAFIANAPSFLEKDLISKCINGATLDELKKTVETTLKKESSEKITAKKGRTSKKVNFGTTQNINVAKIIIQSVITSKNHKSLNAKFENINWDDFKTVTKAFKELLILLESIQTN